MTKNAIPFIMEVPLDYSYCNKPDVRVLCLASRILTDKVVTEFEGIDTNLACSVTDWMAVWNLAQELGYKQWQARDNAREIGTMTVGADGKTSFYPINEEK